MKYGLLITAYEESRKPGKLERAMDCALHPLVDELLVVDDCSSDWIDTKRRIDSWNAEKGQTITVNRRSNHENLGVFGNKLTAISMSRSEWVQSLDSDNWLPSDYWERVDDLPKVPTRMYSPSFAKPNFDYRQVAGKTLRLGTLKEFIGFKHLGCLMNTGNQFFNAWQMQELMKINPVVHNETTQPDYFNRGGKEHVLRPTLKWRKVYDSADSFYFNKRWLEAGFEICIVQDLYYEHEVHQDSSWQAAPPEKEALPPIYFAELYDADKGIARVYKYAGTEKVDGRHCCVLQYDGGKRWIDMNTYEVRKES